MFLRELERATKTPVCVDESSERLACTDEPNLVCADDAAQMSEAEFADESLPSP